MIDIPEVERFGTCSRHLLQSRIVRVVHRTSFRGTPYAEFELESGYFLCVVWFEDGEPRMQIRSNIEHIGNPLEVAAIIAQSIHMACDWAVEEIAKGNNVRHEEEATA